MQRLATRGHSTAIALAFLLGTGFGLLFAVNSARANDIDGTYTKLRVFSQVLSYVQANYVDEIKPEELIYDAISGLLRDLDPHSTFMRPEEFQKLREDTAGEFGGLGIRMVQLDVGVLIEAVDDEGSAARAGLMAGDRIVAIDGDPAGQMQIDEVAKRLRGVPGTKVVVTIARAGWGAARDVSLIRRHVRVDSVDHELLPGGIGYVRIYSFQERTDHELAEALSDLRKRTRAAGARELSGLILDMRDNPGGLLEEGVKVADRFLSKGDIVKTQGRNARHVERHIAHERGTEGSYPMVTLINGGTASASEIVAGALQDQGRAKAAGTRSYGKGSVQTLFGLEDGSGLKLTIARYYTPSGRSIQKVGIQPDIPIAARPGDVIASPGAAPEQRLAQDAVLTAAVAFVGAEHKRPATRK